MIDIKKELDKNQTILGVMESEKYNEAIITVPKILASKGTICYVTLNKTSSSLIEIFKKNKINLSNIVFIDAISKSFKKSPNKSDQVYFVSSPGAFTEISLVLSKFLKHKFDYVIFDSVTNLMTYHNKTIINKFLKTLVSNIKKTKSKSLFFTLNIKEHQSLIKQGNMFFDKVIKCCEEEKKVIKKKVSK